MLKLILIRHCETDWNREGKFFGKKDIPLNALGIEQSRLLAKQLKEENITAIYSSALSRAAKTAKLIAGFHSLEVKQLAGFNEIDFGEWEGLTFNEIESAFKTQSATYLKNPASFRFPKGETLQELNTRVLKALDTVLSSHSDETVLIVAHSGTNRAIIGKALGLGFENHLRLKQDIGCLNVIEFFEDTATILLLNSPTYKRGE